MWEEVEAAHVLDTTSFGFDSRLGGIKIGVGWDNQKAVGYWRKVVVGLVGMLVVEGLEIAGCLQIWFIMVVSESLPV